MSSLDLITTIIIVGCCLIGIFFLLPTSHQCVVSPEEPLNLIQFTIYIDNNSSIIPGADLQVNAMWCSGKAIGTTDKNGRVDLLMYKASRYNAIISNESFYNKFNIGYPEENNYILFLRE